MVDGCLLTSTTPTQSALRRRKHDDAVASGGRAGKLPFVLMVDAIDGQLKACVVGPKGRRSRRFAAQTRRRRCQRWPRPETCSPC